MLGAPFAVILHEKCSVEVYRIYTGNVNAVRGFVAYYLPLASSRSVPYVVDMSTFVQTRQDWQLGARRRVREETRRNLRVSSPRHPARRRSQDCAFKRLLATVCLLVSETFVLYSVRVLEGLQFVHESRRKTGRPIEGRWPWYNCGGGALWIDHDCRTHGTSSVCVCSLSLGARGGL